MRKSTVIVAVGWVLWCVLIEWLSYRSKRKQPRWRWIIREAVGLVIALAVVVIISYVWGE